jgi:3-methyladenine DNA glycosylase Tag
MATTAESIALSKDLRKRGWTFVGPTTIYAFMQAMGLVNDHVEECEIGRDQRGPMTSEQTKVARRT